MTIEIALVFSILAAAILLFFTERLRVDLIALLVLGSLALTDLVTPEQALSGFSNPAVVTVWAVFILSSGLARTGVANIVGRQVLRLAGPGEIGLLVMIMLTSGLLSAFMNNVGVAALMLPVVMDIARRTERPPSKLLMPLAFGSLLGGLITLIGTPPNILISDALRDYGLRPFQLFDFAPVGIAVMLVGTAFMVLVGRRLLPARDIAKEFAAADQTDLGEFYHLREHLFVVHVPPASTLAGKTLHASRLGAALGLNVIAILRDGRTRLAPTPETTLHPDDRLLVMGQSHALSELHSQQHLVVENGRPAFEALASGEIEFAEAKLAPLTSLSGQTLPQIDFRRRFGVNVLAIQRGGETSLTDLETMPLQAGDILLLQGSRTELEKLGASADFDRVKVTSKAEVMDVYHLQERLIAIEVPSDSTMVGRTLVESRLGDAYGLTALAIIRDGDTRLMPSPQQQLQAGDTLVVAGNPEILLELRGPQDLKIDHEISPDLDTLESERVGMAEVVLSPHTTLVGKSLRNIRFRDKYELNVLAVWRGGRAFRSDLRDMPLQFGDALLLYGSRERIQMLGGEPDFLVLTEAAQEVPLTSKAPLAVLILSAVLLPVILGWLTIAVAAVVGATLMIVTGCLSMDEAYRFIEWKAVFLIAGMLPLGIAMEQTGAASLLAERVVGLVGGFGPLAVVVSLFVLATLTSQVMPNAAVAVLLAPIALNTANDLGISPYALMMTVALSASASFLSPVAHPANLLILGPGGYRFTDYLKVGLPLSLVILVVVCLILPIFWPLTP